MTAGRTLGIALVAILASIIGASAAIAETPASSTTRPANRLAAEASPYLRQHAHNPVDWYPWGEEAFAKARRENKPIFLSVGYATCHWCHVMARESFENTDIAKLLNDHVVSIKVDRERHPEVDQTYMLATELITQQGGWPNSVFLTPDLKPFYAATYLPPDVFRETVARLATVWQSEQAALIADSDKVADVIRRIMTSRIATQSIGEPALRAARAKLLDGLDTFHGGIGVAPKFPREPHLLALLHFAERDGDAKALEAARLTLDNILRGGIHDQLGGGFHRYAVDNAWVVPHFEKMLYNQALLVPALIRAHRLTGAGHYAAAARRALDFVTREMTSKDGGFYSALDAETNGKEGLYYLWTPAEIKEALGSDDAAFAIKAFGATNAGNLEGTNVLHHRDAEAETAASLKLDVNAFQTRLDTVRVKLLAARDLRPRPKRDDKILSAWNGAMILAFAEAGRALGEKSYVETAQRAAAFVWERMGGKDGELKRSYFDGRADLAATQADHVHLALAFLRLFDVTAEVVWLERAAQLAEVMHTRFFDPAAGDYFMTAEAAGFLRAKSRDDGELPSGTSAALELFSRLSRRHANPEWRHRADAIAAALSGLARATPSANAYGLGVIDLHQNGETGPLQFAGKGAVRISAARTSSGVAVTLDIAPGWHVNAPKPLEDFLIPTKLGVEGDAAAAVAYPPAVRRRLSFNAQELALYEGRVALAVTPSPEVSEPLRLKLEIQTCSDKICLDPEMLALRAPPAGSPPK